MTTILPSTLLDGLRAEDASVLRSWRRSLLAAGRSPKTIRSYLDAGVLLAKWSVDRPLEQLRRADLENFFAAELERTSHGSTAVRWRSIRILFGYLLAEELVEAHPMTGMRMPRPTARPVPVVTDADLRALLRTCAGRDPIDRRDQAVIRLLLDTGIRVSELTGLEVGDVDLDLDQIVVEGKGRKVRIVPVSPRTGQALERWLRVRGQLPAAGRTQGLWPGTRRMPLSPSGVAQMLRRRCAEAGIGHVHPHQLRHTAAHELAAAGASTSDMQRVFGWSTPEMASRYGASAADERARATVRRLARGDRV